MEGTGAVLLIYSTDAGTGLSGSGRSTASINSPGGLSPLQGAGRFSLPDSFARPRRDLPEKPHQKPGPSAARNAQYSRRSPGTFRTRSLHQAVPPRHPVT
jgi:hypothetical protein